MNAQRYEDESLRQLRALPVEEQAKMVKCRYGSCLFFSCPYGMGLSSSPCDHCVRPEALAWRGEEPDGS